ncbi:MAG TPA: hypothetical protein VHV31_07935, partial [Nitrolancea sp.]|nr:hypothetical protein [Nitrolancea sp.]
KIVINGTDAPTLDFASWDCGHVQYLFLYQYEYSLESIPARECCQTTVPHFAPRTNPDLRRR